VRRRRARRLRLRSERLSRRRNPKAKLVLHLIVYLAPA
jgi:hypothetical protein